MLSPWGKFVYYFSKYLFIAAGKIFFRLSYEGTENVPRRGGVILAANHCSNFDPPVVGIGIPRYVFFLVKTELFGRGFLRSYFQLLHEIEVARGRQGSSALGEAEHRIKKGHVVMIFPEGTRSYDGKLLKGRSGVSLLALRTGCPVVPAAVIGTHLAFPKGKWRLRFVKLTVRFGKPLTFPPFNEGDRIPREALDNATFQIMSAIEALLPEAQRLTAEQRTEYYGVSGA